MAERPSLWIEFQGRIPANVPEPDYVTAFRKQYGHGDSAEEWRYHAWDWIERRVGMIFMRIAALQLADALTRIEQLERMLEE
jgi:hypothetical protein